MLPMIAAAGALAILGNALFRSPSKDAARGVQATCQEKYCPPTYLIHVDKAKHTLMRDDRAMVGGTIDQQLRAAYQLTKATYYKEAHMHPGVRMVAGAVP